MSDRPRLWYGGDYNPEQWPREVWNQDVRLMQDAGVNLVTVGVFSWAHLEPSEGRYEFGWLDDVLDLLHKAGVKVDLATATASPPAWLSRRYPDSLPVTEDGVRLGQGSRQHYCPSSDVYRAKAAELVRRLVDRYADHPALAMWHVNNEYGCHVSRCYCPASTVAFRAWLQTRYGMVEALNEAWGTAFWSQRYDSFDEVLPPAAAPTFRNPTQLLDFDRFSSAELLACYRAEVDVIRQRSGLPVTTNFLGVFKPVDYWSWAPHVDLVALDSYPDPVDPLAPSRAAMEHDLMRSLRHGQPWLLMEQAPSAVNWRTRNAPKAPGQMRAGSYQAVARGADGVLFFQWRQARAGAEKFHSALLPHAGVDTRVWREAVGLGGELAQLSAGSAPVAGQRVASQVAITFDWDSWWAIEQPSSPATVSYHDTVFAWHRALSGHGVTVDFVQGGDDLSGYRLVVVPAHMVATDAQLANLASVVEAGATLVVGFGSAITDEHLHVRLDGYLGSLQQTLGVWIEEFAPPAAAHGHQLPGGVGVDGDVFAGRTTGTQWAEYVRVRDAQVLATFTGGPLGGWPAVTRRGGTAGAAWYVATLPEPDALARLCAHLLAEAAVPTRADLTTGGSEVETVQRGDLVFAVNHGTDEVRILQDGTDVLTGTPVRTAALGPYGVAAVRPAELADQRRARTTNPPAGGSR